MQQGARDTTIAQMSNPKQCGLAGNWGAFNFGAWPGKGVQGKLVGLPGGAIVGTSEILHIGLPLFGNCLLLLLRCICKDTPSCASACSTWMWQLSLGFLQLLVTTESQTHLFASAWPDTLVHWWASLEVHTSMT